MKEPIDSTTESADRLRYRDNRESLFQSPNLADLVHFYDSFQDFGEFEHFFRKRCKSDPIVTFLEGSHVNPFVFVVPTSDINGRLALQFRNSFATVSTIFVQSSGPTFNFSHSMNVGIREALKKGKEWIILSNDDVTLPGPIGQLLNEIEKNSRSEWLKPMVTSLGRRIPASWTLSVLPQHGLSTRIWDWSRNGNKELAPTYRLIKKYSELFGVKPILAVQREPIQSLTDLAVSMFRVSGIGRFLNVQPISIFKADVIRDYLFDEVYCNACEDMDLALRLHLDGHFGTRIRSSLVTASGASLGHSRARWLRYGLSGRLIFASRAEGLLGRLRGA